MCGWIILALFFIVPSQTGTGSEQPILDFWEAIYLKGGHVGHAHTVAEKISQDGMPMIRTTCTWSLKVRRGDEILPVAVDSGTTESVDGKLRVTFMRQYVGKQQALEVVGTVVGKELRLVRDKNVAMHPAPWSEDAVSLLGRQKLLQSHKLTPGERFTFRSFDHTVSLFINNEVKVGKLEKVELFGEAEKNELLRVEIHPEKLPSVPQAPLLLWLNEKKEPVRTETEVAGLGKLVFYRTSAERAQAPVEFAALRDLLAQKYVPTNRRIPRPQETIAAVYRIIVKDADKPAETFAQDDRQQSKNLKNGAFELHVGSLSAPKEKDSQTKAAPEFTQSSFYITSDDAQVKKHARQAVGSEQDPWKKAVRIEKWVFDHMSPSQDQSVTPADQVARSLTGDCTEYAMLMAAMCRAEAVPSRTAVGFKYGENDGNPVFMPWMWTEVWVQGRWLPLDATQGVGRVAATHLTISHLSWHDERSLTPLLPLARLLDRVSIEIIRTE